MKNLNATGGNRAARTAKNTMSLALWTAAWLITMALANFGPSFIWEHNKTLTVIATVVNLLVGAGMILANKRHLQNLDELQQKVQLEAMALSLGVGLVVGLSYSNLDVSDIIPADAEISHMVILMALTYLGGVVFGMRKYR